MKSRFLVVIGVLLAMVILSVSCTPKATPPAAPTPAPSAPTTQNVTGTLKDVNTPDEPGRDVVTIETPQGLKTFPVTTDTTFSLEGQACPIGQVGQAVASGNASYNCTIIVDDEGVAVSVYASKKVE